MTGTWPHQNGCTRNSVALPAHLKCLPEFIDPGYASAYFGKWHLGNEAEPQRGFQHWISTEYVSDYSRFLLSRGYKPDRAGGGFSQTFVSNLPIELSKTQFLERHACEFIEKHAGGPFVLFVGFVEPHSPYNGPLNDIHPLTEVELEPAIPLSDATPLRYQLMREWQRAEALLDRERLPMQYFFGASPEECKSIKQRYLGLVTQVDRSIGAILESLRRNGVFDDTVIVHTSDHGDMLGAHELFGKEVMFEEAVRVPWLIKLRQEKGARRIAQPVSQIDLLPTLVELLGGEASAQFAGKSLCSVARGQGTARPVFIEWAPNRAKVKKRTKLASRWRVKRATAESTRTIVTVEGWKLSLRNQDRSELYNLHDDPAETRNLYSSLTRTETAARLREELHRWQDQTGDKLRV